MLNGKSIYKIMPEAIKCERPRSYQMPLDKLKKMKQRIKDSLFDTKKYQDIADEFELDISSIYKHARNLK